MSPRTTAAQKRLCVNPRVRVVVRHVQTGEPAFDLIFYGIPCEEFPQYTKRVDKAVTSAAKRRRLTEFGYYLDLGSARCLTQHDAQPPHALDRANEGRSHLR